MAYERIIIEGDITNIDQSILKQAFARILEIRESTKIEGKNYSLEIDLKRKNIVGRLEKRKN